ncbi:MAG: SprT-like domain-containing protein [Lentimicrobium sp.]|jgi:hypothetical protein|nr:SprT-like domain-containing protein [Lentimicrobium sp.]MDD2529320.1 SprT-like domain-containing protein [Lentimicrobiaceae bacterium]MDD4599040.1 SprT-like domain-containing protein [Lentimicrobiaceae bacterium]MDY0027037.1 SprT-like domain-containing protein [Lentimicrobium sp.]
MKFSRAQNLMVLHDFIPSVSLSFVIQWFQDHDVHLKITRERISKLGDFRAGSGVAVPTISVNYNLNEYSFLITLLHEMAHAEVWLSSKKRNRPHGKAWKSAFLNLSQPYFQAEVFPVDLAAAFKAYLKNPTASTMSFQPLNMALKAYDKREHGLISIADLPENSIFRLAGGRTFIKGQKVRTRFRCICLNNKRVYLFNPMAEVSPESNKPKS